MDRIDCPRCFDCHGVKAPMWQVPLESKHQTNWLHQCPVCHLIFSTDDRATSEDAARVHATDGWEILGLKSLKSTQESTVESTQQSVNNQ